MTHIEIGDRVLVIRGITATERALMSAGRAQLTYVRADNGDAICRDATGAVWAVHPAALTSLEDDPTWRCNGCGATGLYSGETHICWAKRVTTRVGPGVLVQRR
jgi:hypothetical protein